MIDTQELAGLGLTSYEAAAYLALLERAEPTSADVAARAAIPRQRVYDVLGSLAAKGLCLARDGAPRTFAAVDPATALELLAREREAALVRQGAAGLARARRLADSLGPVFAAGRGETDPLAYVEVLSGPRRIAGRALALAEGAQKSVASAIARPMILSLEQNRAFMRVPLGRGLSYRALCDDGVLADGALAAFLGELRPLGLAVRTVPALPLKMQIFDDESVLLSMQDPAGGAARFTAVVIHNRGVASMLGLAFEHLWQGANPLTEGR
ncbi:TrmB family transcriptional regulator [Solidesulfovibrio sp.]|uniref:TrmB family transcriptional regulator n=1 Tax=Solidesulfovibrio sp. TaxID=2910990 RepID=UPI002B20C139|nr:helix-turn-helix domain-containing protein [Solidesulfovibrio sp.]MEA4858455.1 helix-turn-helix domain-containing protein [Solidesulfovibrio sp.]